MSKSSMLAAGVVLAGGLAAIMPGHASDYSVVYSFKGGTDGAEPFAGLIDVGGTLYGTTETGGAADDGTIFTVTPAGVETVLYSFVGGDDGKFPVGGLIKSGAVLYGTTSAGGTDCGGSGCGTVFKVTTSGVETVLYRFTNIDPITPLGTLIVSGGDLYGTTYEGAEYVSGAAFKVTKGGRETTLHAFGSGTDGADPVDGLIDVGATFYGTTESGGANEYGTVFSMTPDGTDTVLYSFKGGKSDGAGPQGALIEVGGTLYGTTGNGGMNNNYSYGTVFKITTDGQEKVMHKFGPLKGPDGSVPLSDLIKVSGILYGTTYGGGADGFGTVFAIKP